MQVGIIGSGRISFDLAVQLENFNHNVVLHNIHGSQSKKIVITLEDLALRVESKRVIWLMLDESEIDDVLYELTPLLGVSDIIIAATDSPYNETMRRARDLEAVQIDYLDLGYNLAPKNQLPILGATIGGNRFAFNYCEPLFKEIAANQNYLYCGKSGAGHFVNEIHNQLKTGSIPSIQKAAEILQSSNYNLNIERILKIWNC